MATPNLATVDLNLLVVFEALLIERSVSRAAQRLGLAQPSVSNALNRLRLLLADDVFVRTPREMRPTPRALQLAEPIIDALQHVRSAFTPADEFDPSTSTHKFTIAAADNADFALALVGKRLSEAAPNAVFNIISLAGSATAYSVIDEGSVDVAVGLFRALPKRFSTASLYWERYVCIADHEHPDLADGLTLEKLVALPHLAVTRDAGMIDAALAGLGLRRHVTVRVPFFAVVPYLIQGSRLLAVVGERVGHHLATTMDVRCYPLPLDIEPWNISAVWPRQGNSPNEAVDWLVTMLRRASALLG
jgi:DNA-binding transcriptional LysR family regulator